MNKGERRLNFGCLLNQVNVTPGAAFLPAASLSLLQALILGLAFSSLSCLHLKTEPEKIVSSCNFREFLLQEGIKKCRC